jgi:hypothetical protein
MLAVVQRGSDGGPAVLQFYTPDAQWVHDVRLPTGHMVTADSLSPNGRHWAYVTGMASGPDDIKQGKPLQDDSYLVTDQGNGPGDL